MKKGDVLLNREELIRELEIRSESYIVRFDKALIKVFDNHQWSSFHEPLLYATHGGKRIRPLILMLAAEAVGVPSTKTDLSSVAVELLHTESIIHDDIIDEQIKRRDRDSFHKRYGNNTSILTADFVFGIILEIASRYNDPRVAKELSLAAIKMCEGEQRELSMNSREVPWVEYLTVISEKTAALFQTSSKLGAIIGGGNEEEIDGLAGFGVNLGIAYQIHDDILDWETDRKFSNDMNGDNEIRENEYVTLTKLKEMANVYAENAKNGLDVIKDSEQKEFLHDLADFTIRRDY
uniref:Polyprenyl synthetase (IspB) n=1 Tax=uncultured marine thaumarchaeote AD1000_41_C07 TaxID=1455916 RepID=A0A075FWU1_9ARCH|nr:polyprenyl synthetase (ispB) [uncultured marine thaumarchaeote AD1000_41_C07]|tara:strand:+ start:236 stop:1114 length:879 start_codon:yes stop_codon:yes gene_type:complete